nr:hypothetical protein BgiMline_022697 [Biomphalaria glabrata]
MVISDSGRGALQLLETSVHSPIIKSHSPGSTKHFLSLIQQMKRVEVNIVSRKKRKKKSWSPVGHEIKRTPKTKMFATRNLLMPSEIQ